LTKAADFVIVFTLRLTDIADVACANKDRYIQSYITEIHMMMNCLTHDFRLKTDLHTRTSMASGGVTGFIF